MIRTSTDALESTLAPSGRTVAAHFFLLLTDYASRSHLGLEALLDRAGLAAHDALTDANGRVPFETFRRLCDVAAQALQEPDLGLRLGQNIRPGHLGSHGYALMNCNTALELARQSARYSALSIDACHNTVEHRGAEFVRVLHSDLPGGASTGRVCEDLQHATAVTFARWITNRDDINPTWVAFSYPRPHDVQAYERMFRCPLHFGAGEVAIAMDARLADLPLPHANPLIHRMMNDVCEQSLRSIGSALEPRWLASARRATLQAFQHGIPSLEAIAQAIDQDEGAFRQHLANQGLSFRRFVDDMRQALAMGYMRDPSLSLVDIAYLLGFSEQSAFQRAFKRWVGVTPGEYRRQIQNGSMSSQGSLPGQRETP